MNISIYITYVFVYICINIHMYVHICMCIYKHTQIYKPMYTHTLIYRTARTLTYRMYQFNERSASYVNNE